MRHAQSEANQAEIMCGGGVDTPLSNNGISQAEYVGKFLQKNPLKYTPCHIIHTGMKRTHHTASIINKALNCKMTEEILLKEHLVGEWEGKTWTDIDALFLNKQDPPSGEAYIDFQNRILKGFDNIFNQYDMPFIVAHGGVFKAFQDRHGVKNPIVMPNATIYFMEYDSLLSPFKWHLHEICAPSLSYI